MYRRSRPRKEERLSPLHQWGTGHHSQSAHSMDWLFGMARWLPSSPSQCRFRSLLLYEALDCIIDRTSPGRIRQLLKGIIDRSPRPQAFSTNLHAAWKIPARNIVTERARAPEKIASLLVINPVGGIKTLSAHKSANTFCPRFGLSHSGRSLKAASSLYLSQTVLLLISFGLGIRPSSTLWSKRVVPTPM